MDVKTVSAIIIILAVLAIFLILLNVYKRGKRVNKRNPDVIDRYSSMILKHTNSDEKLKSFIQTEKGKITVYIIIGLLVIVLFYSLYGLIR